MNLDNCPHRIGCSDKRGHYYDGCKLRGPASPSNSNYCIGDEKGCDILQEKMNFTRDILK